MSSTLLEDHLKHRQHRAGESSAYRLTRRLYAAAWQLGVSPLNALQAASQFAISSRNAECRSVLDRASQRTPCV